MREAIFTNGVFRTVVEEIISAQKKDTQLISYLQPYSSGTIKLLATNPPSASKPLRLYISTTDNLTNICYMADIVGWENKKEIPTERLNALNAHILKHQPSGELGTATK